MRNVLKKCLSKSLSRAIIVVALFALSLAIVPTNQPQHALADTQDDLNAVNAQLNSANQDLSTKQSQIKTLGDQINVLNGQISQTQLQIQATNDKIAITKEQITQTEEKLAKEKDTLNSFLITLYENGNTSPLEMIASSNNFSDFVDQSEYLQTMQLKVQNTLDQIKETKANLDKTKIDEENLKNSLTSQETDLSNKKSAQSTLLAMTQNDASLLQNNIKDLNAKKGVLECVLSGGCGGDPNGNLVAVNDPSFPYYNQGNYTDTYPVPHYLNIPNNGCLVTSYAMVRSHSFPGHPGIATTPIDEAGMHYFSGDVMTDHGEETHSGSANWSEINSSLDNSIPVIVEVNTHNSSYPTHFVVIISHSGNTYYINDPAFGKGHKWNSSDIMQVLYFD